MDRIKALSTAETDLSVSVVKPRLFKQLRQTMLETRSTFRTAGLKGVVRRYGLKVFAVFFMYYLVRDLILYIALPWLIAHHFAA